jgi:hypothetical protein
VSAGDIRTGAGVIRYGESGEHVGRQGRTVVSRLGSKEEREAYGEISSMKHSKYQLAGSGLGGPMPSVMRGIQYKQAPKSIKAPDQSLILDERIMNLELAVKEAEREIRELSALVDSAESR